MTLKDGKYFTKKNYFQDIKLCLHLLFKDCNIEPLN